MESSGELLVVIMTRCNRPARVPRAVFNLYRLEEGALVQVEDMAGGLFVGRGSAMRSWVGIEPPNEFFRKDCVCLVDFKEPYFQLERFCIGEEEYKQQQQLDPSCCCCQFNPLPAFSCPWITLSWSSN